MKAEIAANLERVRAAIAAACVRADRDPSTVELVAVSKRQPPEKLRAAIAAGQRIFGENVVQEALKKGAELPAEIEWHLIGTLQSNKAKAAARFFHCVHSVDRPKIAAVLDGESAALGRRLPVFLQAHLGNEPSKHGFEAEELLAQADQLFALPHLEIIGLMAVPPFFADPEASRPFFRELRRLRDLLARDRPAFPGKLSMGMSHDFMVAIEEGATHVRVGTAIFGER